MEISPIHVFGFHTGEQICKIFTNAPKADSSAAATIMNISKIVAYIPIIGTIAGIAKACILANNDAEGRKEFGNGFINAFYARTTIEILSLGAIFLIPDLAVTAQRALFGVHTNPNYQNA